MKKIIFLVVLMILPVYSMAYTDTNNHWANEYINYLTNSEILSGYPDNTFRPDNNVTRAEFITMLTKTLELPIEDKGEFWADKFVNALKGQGIIEDTNDLNNNILREEVIKMLVKSGKNSRIAYSSKTSNSTNFSDIKNADKEIKNSVEILFKSDILSGYQDGTVRVQNELTRAEACTFIYKFIQNKHKLDNYEVETLFINYSDLPYELNKWKNGDKNENLVTTLINSIDVFKFSEKYEGKYKDIFSEFYISTNPYFEYRRKFGENNYVVAIEFETLNNSSYETVTGYNYLTVEFPEENIEIIDSFDVDEINNQRNKKSYSGVKLQPQDKKTTIAFYIVDNFPQEVIKLSRNVTTMYDNQNNTNVDVESYNSLVIGNLK